ncbi:MAG: protein jag [Candidatus Dojkabacteria bacterium]
MKLTEIAKEELTENIENVLGNITDFLGLEMEYDYKIEGYTTQKSGRDREVIKISLRGEGESSLIGHHGRGLDSLQYLIANSLAHIYKMPVRVVLEVNNYRENREDYLSNLGKRVATQVKESGEEIELEPMPASERRIIHNALQDIAGVKSSSVGEGRERRIVITAENEV